VVQRKIRCYFGKHTWRLKGRPPIYLCVDCGKTAESEPTRLAGGAPPVPPGCPRRLGNGASYASLECIASKV
jgi:hypothetical protein